MGFIVLVCALHFVSRTAIVVAFVSVYIGAIYSFFSKETKGYWIYILIIVVFSLFLKSGFWDMMELKNKTTELMTGNGRLERMAYWMDEEGNIDSFYGVSDYNNKEYKYAHNFWLDFIKLSGWMPGIALVLFSLLSLRDTWLVYKNKFISNNVKLVAVSMTMAIILSFSVEPVFEGSPHSIYAYFILCGIMSALVKTKQS